MKPFLFPNLMVIAAGDFGNIPIKTDDALVNDIDLQIEWLQKEIARIEKKISAKCKLNGAITERVKEEETPRGGVISKIDALLEEITRIEANIAVRCKLNNTTSEDSEEDEDRSRKDVLSKKDVLQGETARVATDKVDITDADEREKYANKPTTAVIHKPNDIQEETAGIDTQERVKCELNGIDTSVRKIEAETKCEPDLEIFVKERSRNELKKIKDITEEISSSISTKDDIQKVLESKASQIAVDCKLNDEITSKANIVNEKGSHLDFEMFVKERANKGLKVIQDISKEKDAIIPFRKTKTEENNENEWKEFVKERADESLKKISDVPKEINISTRKKKCDDIDIPSVESKITIGCDLFSDVRTNTELTDTETGSQFEWDEFVKERAGHISADITDDNSNVGFDADNDAKLHEFVRQRAATGVNCPNIKTKTIECKLSVVATNTVMTDEETGSQLEWVEFVKERAGHFSADIPYDISNVGTDEDSDAQWHEFVRQRAVTGANYPNIKTKTTRCELSCVDTNTVMIDTEKGSQLEWDKFIKERAGHVCAEIRDDISKVGFDADNDNQWHEFVRQRAAMGVNCPNSKTKTTGCELSGVATNTVMIDTEKGSQT